MKQALILLYGGVLPESAELELLLLALIAAFLGLSLILFITIMLYRSIKIADKIYVASLRRQYEELFMAVAFLDESELDAAIKKVKVLNKRFLKKKKYARTITNDLLFLSNSFSGESKHNLRELYMRSDFADYSGKKIRSTHWELQAQGIRELTDMKDDRVLPVLKKISRKKDQLLRENAQISLLKLNGFEGLGFLNEIDTPVSDWQQINLIAALKEYHNRPHPDFSVWLDSPEPTVILFAVRLMHHFKQIEKSDRLLDLLNRKDKKLKAEVMKTLVALNKTEAIPYLAERYGQEDNELKQEIIRTYCHLAEQHHAGILTQWLTAATDPDIRKSCLDAIESLGAMETLRVLQIEDPSLNVLVARRLEKTGKP